MKRLTLLSALLSVSVFACGDDGGDAPDARRPPDAREQIDAADDIDAAPIDAAAPAVTCTPAKPQADATQTYTITSDGIERTYVARVPTGYDGTEGLPVVFDFHGSGSTPDQELMISEMAAAADAGNFIVVLPVGIVPNPSPAGGVTWNVPVNPDAADDVQFTADVITDITAKLCIDPKRVYATGFSGGGRLTALLACELEDKLAAVGTVGGLRFTDPCEQTRQVPIITFHGTADAINPYGGGGPAYWGADTVEEALGKWAEKMGCEATATTVEVSENVDKLSHAGCDGESEIVLYKVTDGGHTWPGTAFPFPANPFGSVTQEIDATQLQVEFFTGHSLP